jgi:murein DD-endopeptidase MepM/ murein hydrolase activator NlpD
MTAGAIALVAFLLCAVGVYWNSHSVHHTLSKAQQENEVLHRDLAQFETSLSDMESRLETTAEMESRARLLAGLTPLEDGSGVLAVGGPDLAIHTEGLDPKLSKRLLKIDGQIDAMERDLVVQEASYQEVLTTLRQRSDELQRTPTIVPLRDNYYLSSGFGRRPDPFTGAASMHEGFDYVAPSGEPFHATARGKVTFAGPKGDFGLTVKLDHGNGIVTVYGHAGKVFVAVGEEVERGQILGVVGATGRVTGPHLHYEVQVDGRPVNPGRFILDRNRVVD